MKRRKEAREKEKKVGSKREEVKGRRGKKEMKEKGGKE